LNRKCNVNRRDKVTLRITYVKNVKFKIVKIKTGCQYIGYFYYTENLNWAAQHLRLGRGLDIFALNKALSRPCVVLWTFILYLFMISSLSMVS